MAACAIADMAPLRILLVHNRYQQYGGEDTVVEAEARLLRDAGHKVDEFFVTNDNIQGLKSKIAAAALTAYNPRARAALRERLRSDRPDIVHVHNLFPQITPSIFDACLDERVPSVMTLHNYRLGCANALLFRDGRPCEDCLHGTAYNAVLHGCYRGSRGGSAVVASMIAYHRHAGTWRNKVSRFIALTEFAKTRLVAAGLPGDKVRIKPNFVPDPMDGKPPHGPGEYALFVGRLSIEKGVDTLLDAWRGLDMPLRILGDGPLREELERAAPANVTFLGHRDRSAVYEEIAGAAFLVVPSIWYEGFPMTVVEAMAMGTPILASAIGGLQEIIADGREGLHFRPGDPQDLRRAVRQACGAPEALRAMSAGARTRYLDRLSPESNGRMLADIYAEILAAG
jgi:glycosyltransferase involved in cell wall biosynthesis